MGMGQTKNWAHNLHSSRVYTHTTKDMWSHTGGGFTLDRKNRLHSGSVSELHNLC